MTLNSAASRLRPSASEAPITSRWCNRALRPLTSTILRLEKHWKISPLGAPNLNNPTVIGLQRESSTSAREERAVSESEPESESSPDDPTWVPGGAVRRRIRHKYSARTGSRSRVIVRSPETQKLLPGEFSIPTPLIKGKERQYREVGEPNGDASGNVMTPGSNEEPSVQSSRRGPAKRKLPSYAGWNSQRTWKDACHEYNDPSYIAIAQGIFQVWDAFLTMTAPQNNTNRGARSLISMALDTTSKYIAREQEAVNKCEDKEENIDVADVIFTELESIYGTCNGGWKPLKSLVRLHGIRLVCEAIRKRWISPMIARQLSLNSIDSSSYDAAHEILSALLSVTQRIEGPRHLDCSLFSSGHFGVFHTLATYVNKANHLSFFFREVGLLMRQGIVPVEWIATESMKPFVAHAIRSISCEDEDCSASVFFIVNMILAASGSGTYLDVPTSTPTSDTDKLQECHTERWKLHSASHKFLLDPKSRTNEDLAVALNNSVSSILGIFCSAHIVRFKNQSPAIPSALSSMEHIFFILSAIIEHDMHAASCDLTQDRSRPELLRIGHILMAAYLLTCSRNAHREDGNAVDSRTTCLLSTFEYYTRVLKSRRDLTASLSALVTHVSHCCGLTCGEDGFAQLELFTDELTGDKTKPYPTLRALLSKVAVDAALNFAESTSHPEHHSWAAHIQAKAASCINVHLGQKEILALTPSLALSKTGYIWEESIGEWIAAVPANTGHRSPRTYRDQKRYLSNSADDIPNFSDSDDARTSRSSSTFSACSENYASSITSSEFTSPLCTRKRKRIVNNPDLDQKNKRNRTTPASSLSAPPRRLRSAKNHSWNFNIGKDGIDDSDPWIFNRFTRSEIAKKLHLAKSSIPEARALRETRDVNCSRSAFAAVEVRLPEPPLSHSTVEVVIVHDGKNYMTAESPKSSIQEEEDKMLTTRDSIDNNLYDDVGDHHCDDNDIHDEDVLANKPSPRYLLRRKNSGTTSASPHVSSPIVPITRLRRTRSSTSLRNRSMLKVVDYNIVGSSDDELSFL
ncbi:hypothetical protein AJ78_01810 [Emergomyces pasteurianus Ep9510]|uniref:Uncharacterized protein n=1 Tax=Emergomyces pasteurianus Ep9510 TaxID=1447872 RepID=A0A1J9PNT9_9EURO|nr:hypothetical protein AJ78_01810 [Emergomyces pasteurianus Ep9510]